MLVDNTETDVFQIDDEQNVRITLPPNTEKVEIISSHVLVLHTYSSIYGEFCKMLDEVNHASPHKQLEIGFLVKDIICKDGLELIFHTITNNPACVTEDNVEEFYQRGYSTENFFSLPFSEIYKLKDSIIRYSIYDAALESVEFDGKVIRFNVDSGKNGMLSVSIPREILIDENSQNAVDLRHRDCRSEAYSHDFSSTHLIYLKIFGENTKRIEFGCNFESNR